MPDRSPHAPPTVSRLRSLAATRRMIENPIQVFEEYGASLGDTFVFYFGGIKKVIVSSHPTVMQHVLKTNWENYRKSEIQMKRMRRFLGQGLLTSHGEAWRTQRQLMQQGFRRDQLRALDAAMHDALAESLEAFDRAIDHGPVDIGAAMTRITFHMVSQSLFSMRLTDADVDLISATISAIQAFIVRQIVQPYLDPWRALSGQLRKHDAMRARGDRIVLEHIRSRRHEHRPHCDLLQILLDARGGEAGEGMNDEAILSESMQLLVAGHETSSNALTWTLYLLGHHLEYVARIRAELDRELSGKPVGYEDVPKLRFTTQVIDESLRLYPPFWMVDRVAVADDRVMDVEIPGGTTVIAFIYGVHRSPRYWSDPDRFVPERFGTGDKARHEPFTHLPFGGGPRSCIGGNYALLQILMVLSALLKRYDFTLVPDQTVEPRSMLVLRPSNEIRMRVARVPPRRPAS